jgi:integrase/recombinase XerD
MADHNFSFQTTYTFSSFLNQGVLNTPEHLFRTAPSKPEPSPSTPQPLETVHSRKEKLRRQALDRVLQLITAQDLPGREHAISYMQHKFRRNCKSCTLASSGTAVRFFLAMLKRNGRDLLDITRQDIEAFIEQEQDRGLVVRSVRNRTQALYSFVRYLVENDVIDPDILTRKIKMKMPVSLPRAIDSVDLRVLFSGLDHTRDRALFLLLLRTGMRVGELLDLRVTDISLPEKKILIYMGEKNYRGRVVYMGEDAVEAAEAWLSIRDSRQEMLFYSSRRPSLSYAAVRNRFTKYLGKAGLSGKGYTIHCLRHTFASEMLNAGLRLEVLQQLLGHSSLEVTRQYARLTDRTREDEYFRAMAVIERGEIHGCY